MNERSFIYIFVHLGSLSRAAFCLIPYQQLCFVNTCTEPIESEQLISI